MNKYKEESKNTEKIVTEANTHSTICILIMCAQITSFIIHVIQSQTVSTMSNLDNESIFIASTMVTFTYDDHIHLRCPVQHMWFFTSAIKFM